MLIRILDAQNKKEREKKWKHILHTLQNNLRLQNT